jgi:RNA polymerase sigma factor (sigma-70 family)
MLKKLKGGQSLPSLLWCGQEDSNLHESQRQAIEQTIREVEQDRDRELLELRYLKGHTWERIAEEMNYSSEYIQRLHKKAVILLGGNVSLHP